MRYIKGKKEREKRKNIMGGYINIAFSSVLCVLKNHNILMRYNLHHFVCLKHAYFLRTFCVLPCVLPYKNSQANISNYIRMISLTFYKMEGEICQTL